MAKIRVFGPVEDGTFAHMCPACGDEHIFYTKKPPGAHAWTFNGDFEKPTFGPSMLIRWGNKIPGHENLEEGRVCHYFVKNGMIEYCGDCTHPMANQKLELPDIKLPDYLK